MIDTRRPVVRPEAMRRGRREPRAGAGLGGITAVHPNRTGRLVLRAGEDRDGVIVYFQSEVNDQLQWAVFRNALGPELLVIARTRVLRASLQGGGSLFYDMATIGGSND